jgi:translation initiation factor 2 beta subunit (eIF-2beta)/eIF-5
MINIITARSKVFTISCKACGSDNTRVSLINEPVEMGHELGNVISAFLKCKSCGKEEWVVDTTI